MARHSWFAATALVLALAGCTPAPTTSTAGPAPATTGTSAPEGSVPATTASVPATTATSSPGGTDPSASAPEPSASPGTGIASPGTDGGACGLGDEQVRLLARDWQRVVDSVGLNRHLRYAKALVDRVAAITETASGCPGAERLPELATLAGELEDLARSGEAPYDTLDAFRVAGNAWLEAVGYDPVLLS